MISGGIYEGPGGQKLHGDGKPVGEPQVAGEAPCSASWHVSLDCACLKCGEYVNLLDAPDSSDRRAVEDKLRKLLNP